MSQKYLSLNKKNFLVLNLLMCLVILTERGADASFYVFSKTTNSIIIKFAQIGVSNTATATEQNGPVNNGDETDGQFTFVNLTPGTVYDVTLRITRAGQSTVTTSQMVQTRKPHLSYVI